MAVSRAQLHGLPVGGKLRSINHVDAYEIIDTPFGHVPGAPEMGWDVPHFLLHLGTPIRPDHKVANGSIYPMRRSSPTSICC
jgi:hypothetical protein